MEPQQPMEDLKRIRVLMERSAVYHSLSGVSGIAAGLIGIIVYALVYGLVDPMVEKNPEMKFTPEGQSYLIKIFFIASVVCLLLTFLAILFFNWKRAQRLGLPFLDDSMQKMFINLFTPLIPGAVYCIVLVIEQQFLLIPPTMLIFYGIAVIMASRYTIIEIRYLGIIELCLGLIALFIKEYGMWFWLVGFGFINLGYGIYMYFRYDRHTHNPGSSEVSKS